jgi:hypothetical protein
MASSRGSYADMSQAVVCGQKKEAVSKLAQPLVGIDVVIITR